MRNKNFASSVFRLFFLFLLFLPPAVRAQGAPLSDLDALRYIASYPDLIQAFGVDAAKGRAHYESSGAKEGRTISFDPLRYTASYSDLMSAFGTDQTQSVIHYIRSGFKEGRKVTFDALRYTASYPDLIEAFGLDESKASSHYIRTGYREGRKPTFDALRYTASYPDLIEAFGLDEAKATIHYVRSGYREGRRATFDALRYTASYPDLIEAFGMDEAKATAHYIRSGYRERRQKIYSDLDALQYVASFGDLIRAFGTDVWSGIRHYIQRGYQEGRKTIFNALAYIASYGDLIAAFSTDAIAGAKHYITRGFDEGRRVTFDALGYLAAYSDLQEAFGTDTVAATRHYIVWGFNERRSFLWTVSATAGFGGQVSATRLYANNGQRLAITVTPLNGYITERVTGCGGSLSGSTYTTAPITGTCAISASFVVKPPLSYRYRGLITLDSTYWSTPETNETAELEVGDLNGDGHLDLLVVGANYPWNDAAMPANPARPGRVFLGDGQGGFARASASLFPVDDLLTVHPRKILWADFNGDGRSDVFIADHGWDAPPSPGQQNLLFLSTPAGGWRSATATLPQVSDFSHTAAAADIDRDGDIDIFVGNGYNNNGAPLTAPYLLINDGQGRFTRNDADVPVAPGQALYMFPAGGGAVHFTGAAFSDLDGDGWPDLVITADAYWSYDKFRQTTVFWNQHGRFDSTHTTRLPEKSGFPSRIDLDIDFADFDGDGLRDIVLIGTNGNPSYDAGYVQLLRGLGQRGFADVSEQVFPEDGQLGAAYGVRTGRPWPKWVRVVDFNGDLAPDFRVELNGALKQDTPFVWINDGKGNFSVIKTEFFVEAGQEWSFGNGLLVPSSTGFQNYSIQVRPGSGGGGLLLTGRVTSKPYFGRPDDAGDEMLVGTAGTNWFVGGRGNDVIDGKAGVDYATYSGRSSGYSIVRDTVGGCASGFTVVDLDPTDGDEGIDRVLSIEWLRFSDKVIETSTLCGG